MPSDDPRPSIQGHNSQSARINERLVLVCQVSGEQPIRVKWLKNQNEINDRRLDFDPSSNSLIINNVCYSNTSNRLLRKTKMQPQTKHKEMSLLCFLSLYLSTIHLQVLQEDQGVWTCFAENKHGNFAHHVNVESKWLRIFQFL